MQPGFETLQRLSAKPDNPYLQMLHVGFEIVEFIRTLLGDFGLPMENTAPAKSTFGAIPEFGEALRQSIMQLDGVIQFDGFEPPEREF